MDINSLERKTKAELFELIQSKQAEIDALKSKVQELWTELDDRQSKEHIIEKCEAIIQEILK